jgi:uncharacterized protein
MRIADHSLGRVCWMDLAASQADQAKAFYGSLFGWQAHDDSVPTGGCFTRLQQEGKDIASLYQLHRRHLEAGVPSHWTPYVAVRSAEEMAARAETCGGRLIVPPFDIDGIARIALIVDSIGAPLGLWQRPRGSPGEDEHA